MMDGLYSAAAGLFAQQSRMDMLSNDIANVSTTGYKQERVGFRDLIYNQEGGVPIGAGSAVVNAGRDFSPGAFNQTGDPLSVAIAGPGFFQVRTADGKTALTRSGDFQLDADGSLVTQSGQRLVPPITVPKGDSASDVSISAQGVVKAKGTTIGKITVVDVPGEGGLLSIGDNLYMPTAASGAPQPAGKDTTVQQGYLEASNVDLGSAMVDVMDSERSYQLDSQMISTQDQMMQIANQIRQ